MSEKLYRLLAPPWMGYGGQLVIDTLTYTIDSTGTVSVPIWVAHKLILQGFAVDQTANLRAHTGAAWFVDDGVPKATIGSDGDLYLDRASGDVYQKESGSWL